MHTHAWLYIQTGCFGLQCMYTLNIYNYMLIATCLLNSGVCLSERKCVHIAICLFILFSFYILCVYVLNFVISCYHILSYLHSMWGWDISYCICDCVSVCGSSTVRMIPTSECEGGILATAYATVWVCACGSSTVRMIPTSECREWIHFPHCYSLSDHYYLHC